MIRYVINFLNGDTKEITHEEYLLLWPLMLVDNPTIIGHTATKERRLDIVFANVSYIESKEIEEKPDKVVTPPTAAQIRSKKEQEEADRPRTLATELSDPELGKQ